MRLKSKATSPIHMSAILLYICQAYLFMLFIAHFIILCNTGAIVTGLLKATSLDDLIY